MYQLSDKCILVITFLSAHKIHQLKFRFLFFLFTSVYLITHVRERGRNGKMCFRCLDVWPKAKKYEWAAKTRVKTIKCRKWWSLSFKLTSVSSLTIHKIKRKLCTCNSYLLTASLCLWTLQKTEALNKFLSLNFKKMSKHTWYKSHLFTLRSCQLNVIKYF